MTTEEKDSELLSVLMAIDDVLFCEAAGQVGTSSALESLRKLTEKALEKTARKTRTTPRRRSLETTLVKGLSNALDRVDELEAEVERLTTEVNTLEVTLKNVETGGMAYKRERDAVFAESSALSNALDDLVTLKDYRDSYGKTDEYLAKKPAAWQQAREALAAASSQQKPNALNPRRAGDE